MSERPLRACRLRSLALGLLIANMVVHCCVAEAGSCPRRSPGRIVGGTVASLGDWPGVAQLRARSPQGDLLYFCGGSIIAPTLVLTAAHCVHRLERSASGRWLMPGRGIVEVLAATNDLKSAKPQNVFTVADRLLHEDWNGNSHDGNDLAILRLTKPWQGELARLSNSSSADSAARVFAAGFGLLTDRAEGGETVTWDTPTGRIEAGSLTLREVLLPTVGTKTCTQVYPALTSTQLCAGYDEGGHDACTGDSGGPLNAVDELGCPYQIGIISYGDGCAKQHAYGVYTRVSKYLPWIRAKRTDSPWPDVGPMIAERVGAATDRSLDELVAAFTGTRGSLFMSVRPSVQLRIGQPISIQIASAVSGRLLVLDGNSRGDVVQLFPNVYTDEASRIVRAGQPMTVPPSDGRYEFRAVPPAGRGRIVAIVIPDDAQLDPQISKVMTANKPLQLELEPVRYVMNLTRQVVSAFREPNTSTSATNRASHQPEWAVVEQEYTVR